MVGSGQKNSLGVPFALDTYDLTRSPPSERLEQPSVERALLTGSVKLGSYPRFSTIR